MSDKKSKISNRCMQHPVISDETEKLLKYFWDAKLFEGKKGECYVGQKG